MPPVVRYFSRQKNFYFLYYFSASTFNTHSDSLSPCRSAFTMQHYHVCRPTIACPPPHHQVGSDQLVLFFFFFFLFFFTFACSDSIYFKNWILFCVWIMWETERMRGKKKKKSGGERKNRYNSSWYNFLSRKIDLELLHCSLDLEKYCNNFKINLEKFCV